MNSAGSERPTTAAGIGFRPAARRSGRGVGQQLPPSIRIPHMAEHMDDIAIIVCCVLGSNMNSP
jgi:hypothetical protein